MVKKILPLNLLKNKMKEEMWKWRGQGKGEIAMWLKNTAE